jgi:hypothetical protein
MHGGGKTLRDSLSMDLAWHFREIRRKVAGHRNGQIGCGKERPEGGIDVNRPAVGWENF